METLIKMTKEERSLLLYLETCLVDNYGKVCLAKMNSEDLEIAKRWSEERFIQFGRISFKDIIRKSHDKMCSYWVLFSDRAWKLAHEERKVRSERMLAKVTFGRCGLKEIEK